MKSSVLIQAIIHNHINAQRICCLLNRRILTTWREAAARLLTCFIDVGLFVQQISGVRHICINEPREQRVGDRMQLRQTRVARFEAAIHVWLIT